MNAAHGLADAVHRGPASIVIEREVLPVTLNVARQSKAMFRLNKELAGWRAWARAHAEGWPALTPPVAVLVHHLRKNRASIPDTGAPILATKAVIDGLVDAGVLPEDGPDVVRRLTFEAPLIVGHHGLRLTVTEIRDTTGELTL